MIAELNEPDLYHQQYLNLGFKSLKGIDFCDIYLHKAEEILVVRYHAETVIDLEKANAIISATQELLSNHAKYAISDSRAFGLVINKDANKIFKAYPGKGEAIALAILVNNLHIRLLANFFIKVEKPEVSTKAFNSLKAARKWLLNQ
ncbi:MAG: hypothetical protein RIC95_11115 [Vicingaceae bacterium]